MFSACHRTGLAFALLLPLAACERQARNPDKPPQSAERQTVVALSSISPGDGKPAVSASPLGSEFANSASRISAGKRLYRWFNCNGCHANGGGDSGPPLMDDKWIYGGGLDNIVATIREGRPNGMPSFRGKIPDDQIWEIAAYVRSMSGDAAADVAPGRSDRMNTGPAENRRSTPPPTPSGAEPSPAQ